MKVIYYDAYRRQDLEEKFGYEYRGSVEAVLREADFVSLHTPLTAETHHLMNAERLGMMKKTAILVNSSRGPVVDPTALYDALKNGTIWAAGLDVTEPGPLPADHPLLTLANCLVVPHIASASIKTRHAMSELAADNIINVLNGRAPKTPVNREVVQAERVEVNRTIRIKAGGVEATGTLNGSATAGALSGCAAAFDSGSTWGDEIYFGIPIDVEEDNARSVRHRRSTCWARSMATRPFSGVSARARR